MKRSAFRFRMMSVGLIAASMVLAIPAFAQDSTFVKVPSHHGFSATVSALKQAVSSNKMMVMGKINQAKVLSMTGLRLEGAESVLVGNPQMGKKAFGMNPAAGAVLPVRVYVWSDHGKTYVGYFKPSALLGQVDPGFKKMGGMLDMKLGMITKEAAH